LTLAVSPDFVATSDLDLRGDGADKVVLLGGSRFWWGDHELGGRRKGGFQPLGVGGGALQSAGHAVVGGGLSELTGGNFKDGFIGAGFAALLSPVGRGINRRLKLGEPGTGNSWQYLGRTATAATIGGTVTAISGGKFGNGAATAAFMHVVNHEVTSLLKGRELASAQARMGLARELMMTSKAGRLLMQTVESARVVFEFYKEGALGQNTNAVTYYNKVGNSVTFRFTSVGINVMTLAHEYHHAARSMHIHAYGASSEMIAAANDYLLPVSHPSDNLYDGGSVENPAVRAGNIVAYEVHRSLGGSSTGFTPRSSYGNLPTLQAPYGRYNFQGESPPSYTSFGIPRN
jgi:hypothetical protein